LLRRGPARLCTERNGHDRMLRFKILQVRLQHSEKKIDIIGWLRNFEHTNVCFLARHSGFVLMRTRESDRQREFARDEINAAQSQCELLKKPAKNKEQRLGGFDLVIELKTF